MPIAPRVMFKIIDSIDLRNYPMPITFTQIYSEITGTFDVYLDNASEPFDTYIITQANRWLYAYVDLTETNVSTLGEHTLTLVHQTNPLAVARDKFLAVDLGTLGIHFVDENLNPLNYDRLEIFDAKGHYVCTYPVAETNSMYKLNTGTYEDRLYVEVTKHVEGSDKFYYFLYKNSDITEETTYKLTKDSIFYVNFIIKLSDNTVLSAIAKALDGLWSGLGSYLFGAWTGKKYLDGIATFVIQKLSGGSIPIHGYYIDDEGNLIIVIRVTSPGGWIVLLAAVIVAIMISIGIALYSLSLADSSTAQRINAETRQTQESNMNKLIDDIWSDDSLSTQQKVDYTERVRQAYATVGSQVNAGAPSGINISSMINMVVGIMPLMLIVMLMQSLTKMTAQK